jgi:hypothetical protein
MSLILDGTAGLSDVDGTAVTPAIRGTDANTGIFFPAADTIAFSEGGVESMRIDSGGTLVVGTTASPTAGVLSRPPLYVKQFNNSSAFSGMHIEASSDDSILGIGYNGSNFQIGTSYRSTGAYKDITFSTTNAERMRITSAGVVELTSGQLKFPAAQLASTDVNTLDDYEEGTWSPNVGGNATYNNQDGRYTKIGNTVFVEAHLNINVLGTGSTNLLSGLPFAAGTVVEGGATINYFAGLAVNVIQPVMAVNSGTTTMLIYSRTTAGTASSGVSIFGNAARIYFWGHYLV